MLPTWLTGHKSRYEYITRFDDEARRFEEIWKKPFKLWYLLGYTMIFLVQAPALNNMTFAVSLQGQGCIWYFQDLLKINHTNKWILYVDR